MAGSPLASSVSTRESLTRQLVSEILQVGPVRLHLFGLAQLQLVEMARRPAVGDVDQQQLALPSVAPAP